MKVFTPRPSLQAHSHDYSTKFPSRIGGGAFQPCGRARALSSAAGRWCHHRRSQIRCQGVQVSAPPGPDQSCAGTPAEWLRRLDADNGPVHLATTCVSRAQAQSRLSGADASGEFRRLGGLRPRVFRSTTGVDLQLGLNVSAWVVSIPARGEGVG